MDINATAQQKTVLFARIGRREVHLLAVIPISGCVGSSGIGMSMAANKVRGIRAAVCQDVYTASRTRLHNDANVLCLGEDVVGPGLAREIVAAFLDTEFEGGRHAARLEKIKTLEDK